MTKYGKLEIGPRGDNELVMTRMLDAPRNLVYDAFTKPELVRRWLGSMDGWTFPVCEMDVRVGGKYRWVWRKEGAEMGMGGVYREIVPNERIVSTEKFDDPWYEGEAVGTVTFVERDGKTTVTQVMRYQSKEARDSVLEGPAASGVEMSYDKLAEILATMSTKPSERTKLKTTS